MDLLARRVTIPFNGGSISGTIGLLQSVFGEGLVADQLGKNTIVSRRAHTRRRVIGQPATNVKGSSYNLQSWSAAGSGAAVGGEPIRILVNESWWTLRLTGSHDAFNNFLKQGGWAGSKVVLWRSQRGKPHGPFKGSLPEVGA